MSSEGLKRQICGVVEKHIADVRDDERDLIANFIASAVNPAGKDNVGRSYQEKLNHAAEQLAKAARSLEAAKIAIAGLEDIASEALSRQLVGLLSVDDFDAVGTLGTWKPLGYVERIEQFERCLAEFTDQVVFTHVAFGEKAVRHGRGAPQKDGPRAVAQHCFLVFEQYVGVPRHPAWNDYSSETYGRFYLFVKDVFEVTGIKASPEEMVKQAIKKASKI